MKPRHAFLLLLLCLVYAFCVGNSREDKKVGIGLCPSNMFELPDGHRSVYPSVYSKLFLGCKLKNANDKDALDLFYRTGTGHLLSIAGLHLGGISLIIYFLLNAVFYGWSWKKKRSYLPFFRISMFVSLASVFGYVVLIGFELPRARALIMVILSAASLVFVVLRNKFVVLSLTASVVLVVTPSAVYSYSFYYSFICVLAVFLSPSKKAFNICAMIFVFLLPLSLHSSGMLDISSIICNFITIPFFVFFYFPVQLFLFGLLKLGVGWVLPLMDHITAVLVKLLYLLDAVGVRVRISTLPIDTVEAIVLYAVLILALFVIFYRCELNRKKVLIIYCSFFAIALFYSVYLSFNYLQPVDSLTVFDIKKSHRCNGSGDLMLVRTGGFNILVDTGYGDYSVKKILKEIQRSKISTIDYLILSHSDIDHVGGLEYVVRYSGLDVKKILVSPSMYAHRGKLYLKGRIYQVCDHSELVLDQNRRIDFIHPACTDRRRNGNDSAIVSIMTIGPYKIVFTADTPVKILKDLPEINGLRDLSKVLFQFPHHCTAKEDPSPLFSSRPLLGFCTRAPELLKSGVSPGDYGFPVLITGKCGSIEFKFHKKQIKISFQNFSKVYNFN
jgi:competence protein ComEC